MKVRDIIVENTGTMEQQALAYFKQKNTPPTDPDRVEFMRWLNNKPRDPKTHVPYTDFYQARDAFNDIKAKQASASVTQPEKQRSANFRGNQYTGGIPGERNDDTDGDDKPKGAIAKVSQKVSRAVQQGKQTARAAGDKTQSYMDKLSRISNIGVTR
jgi:hypothetical protein